LDKTDEGSIGNEREREKEGEDERRKLREEGRGRADYPKNLLILSRPALWI
jgi:hypothetical protein